MTETPTQLIKRAPTFNDYWRLSDADVERIQRRAQHDRQIAEDTQRLGVMGAISAFVERVM